MEIHFLVNQSCFFWMKDRTIELKFIFISIIILHTYIILATRSDFTRLQYFQLLRWISNKKKTHQP